MNSLQELDSAIDLWFREDIREGDHTTISTIPANAAGSAKLLVKEKGIVAGVSVAQRIFQRFDADVQFVPLIEDGSAISPGDIAFRVSGSVHSLLQCERLVLNVMQRMSGIASKTYEYVRLLEGTGTRILDTRKTTPGMRFLEKEAVRLGGGGNHRFGLFDMILIKDNHIDFAGGIEQAITATKAYLEKKKLDLVIVVETRSLEDIRRVLSIGGVRRILLDNFTVELTKEAVKLIDHRIETESSGGINRETIRQYAACGVDYISVGALTHQINSLDLSLKADFKDGKAN
jgi:nicotinate-nucleotide pyrophosphorylase (carboxylating)